MINPRVIFADVCSVVDHDALHNINMLLLFDATIFNVYRYIALYCRCLEIHSVLLPKNQKDA